MTAFNEKLLSPAGKSQVAFSASLVTAEQETHHGPFDDDTALVFKRVTTNIGNAYNPDTGTTHLFRFRTSDVGLFQTHVLSVFKGIKVCCRSRALLWRSPGELDVLVVV